LSRSPDRRSRVCVVGLDGVPAELLRRLAAAGVMPRTADLVASGHLRTMRASIPEVSSVSWSCFMTGANPGVHGIFGFTDLEPGSYEIRFPSFADLAVPTIWDRLGDRGLRSVVLNQPATYPARVIPGAIVSGFVAVDLARAVRPLPYLAPLRRRGYRLDVDTERARVDHDFLFSELAATLRAREAALDLLWQVEDWDFFQVVVTGTDRLYHFLWDAVADESHPRHREVVAYHRAVDAFIGRVFDRFVETAGDGPRSSFWMLSDHGFCGIVREVQVNAWLVQNGWLRWTDGGAGGLASIGPGSRAFALDPGRIHLNLRDRYPSGCVERGEAATLKREIAAALKELRFEGQPVVRAVHDASRIYQGPVAEAGPDLVAQGHRGFDLKASTSATEVFGRTELTGMHTYDDAFLLTPQPIEGDPWIGDLAQHLTAALN
jgi:predicted AlkP superfamily phosphohydrolase/phosphomutase